MTENYAAATERAMQTQACVTAAKRTEGLINNGIGTAFVLHYHKNERRDHLDIELPDKHKELELIEAATQLPKVSFNCASMSNSIYRTTKYLLFFRLF